MKTIHLLFINDRKPLVSPVNPSHCNQSGIRLVKPGVAAQRKVRAKQRRVSKRVQDLVNSISLMDE